jgi:hypothetical protein
MKAGYAAPDCGAGVLPPELPFSIRQIWFEVKSGEKVGIVMGHGAAQAALLLAITTMAAIAASIINLVIPALMTLSITLPLLISIVVRACGLMISIITQTAGTQISADRIANSPSRHTARIMTFNSIIGKCGSRVHEGDEGRKPGTANEVNIRSPSIPLPPGDA